MLIQRRRPRSKNEEQRAESRRLRAKSRELGTLSPKPYTLSPKSYLSVPPFQKMQFVTAAISTRVGGVSQYPYQTLNLGYHVGDAHEAVTENRRRLCSALGIHVDSLVIAQQVHGDGIAVIDESQTGCGAYRHEDAVPGADGMITRSRSATLAVLTADCVPVMVMDPIRKAIGIAHAGWKGALRIIAAKTVLKMRNAFGTEPADCLVVLGPSIGSCCYRVGQDVISKFQHTFGPTTCVMENRLDLRRAVEIQLADVGVEKRNISSVEERRDVPLCTACNLDLFYSHRAEGGHTGRMMSVIKLI